jgi:hypothetical protein
MPELAWYEVNLLHLTAPLQPDGYGHGTTKFENVGVAFDGAFLHVVPKPFGRRGDGGEVWVVPVSNLVMVRYRMPQPTNR